MSTPRVRSRAAAAAAAVVLAALAGGCSGSTSGPEPTPETAPPQTSLADVREVLEERLAVYDGIVTGVVVLVRVGDETAVLARGRAVRGREDMTGDATWPIASITKMMTATLVLQLVEEGRLALDDDVRRWLPELDAMGPITVEQLLSHRSGIVRDVAFRAIRRVGFSGMAGLLGLAVDRGPEFEAGADGMYSNVGFGALGLLVERVLDQPLDRALRERIFEPAGMGSSSLGGRPSVQGYAPRPVRNYHLDYVPAAGGVVSTVADVDGFLRALWAGDLLDPDLVSDMRESRGQVQVNEFLSLDYGLGVMHQQLSCGEVLGHGGRIRGFTDEAWTLADGTRSAVITVNDEDVDSAVLSILETALCG